MQLGNYPTFLATDSIAKSSPLFEHVDGADRAVRLVGGAAQGQQGAGGPGLHAAGAVVDASRGGRRASSCSTRRCRSSRATTRDRSRSATPPRASSSRSSPASPTPTRRARRSTPTPNTSLPPDAEKPIDESPGAGTPRRASATSNFVSDMYIAGVGALRAGLSDRPARSRSTSWTGWRRTRRCRRSAPRRSRRGRSPTRSDSTPTVLAGGQHRRRAAAVHPVRRGPLAHALGAARARQAVSAQRGAIGHGKADTLSRSSAVVALGAIAFAVLRAPEKGQRSGPPPRPVAGGQGGRRADARADQRQATRRPSLEQAVGGSGASRRPATGRRISRASSSCSTALEKLTLRRRGVAERRQAGRARRRRRQGRARGGQGRRRQRRSPICTSARRSAASRWCAPTARARPGRRRGLYPYIGRARRRRAGATTPSSSWRRPTSTSSPSRRRGRSWCSRRKRAADKDKPNDAKWKIVETTGDGAEDVGRRST